MKILRNQSYIFKKIYNSSTMGLYIKKVGNSLGLNALRYGDMSNICHVSTF